MAGRAPSSVSRRLVIWMVGVTAVLVLATAGALAWRGGEETRLKEAAAFAPTDAERLSWTDWAAVREQVGADADVRRLLTAGFEQDLTSTSALVESAETLDRDYSFSPLSAEWELFSQSAAGAVVIVRLPSADAVDRVAEALDGLGYTEPEDAGGVWVGGDDLLASIGTGLTPELQYLALDRDERLVLASDRAAYLDSVGSGDRGLPESMAGTVSATGDPISAVVYSGAHVCSALAMSQADDAAQAQAEQLVDEVGGVSPLASYSMGVLPGGNLRVVLGFDSEDRARSDADARAALAAGPAPGQGGAFSDRFTVESVTAAGRLVTLDLPPRPGSYALSDLSTGPVLFATC